MMYLSKNLGCFWVYFELEWKIW